MAKRRRTALLAGSLLAGACGSPPPKSTRPAVERDLRAEAAAALARDALYHGDVRRTLYTWTTAEQIDELRSTRRLLSRDESPELGASYLEQVLFALKRRGDSMAELLYTTPFARMRFAWHVPWATRAGWPGERYGDQLIRVTLKPEAIVLSLSTADGRFEARDLRGRSIEIDRVLRMPERIAAIYFVSDATLVRAGLPEASATYREIALCNEGMIESWAAGTHDITRELETNAAALEALARYLRTRDAWQEPPRPPVRLSWARPPEPEARPEQAFAAALAFVNPRYRLDAAALDALAKQLRATPIPRAVTGVGAAWAGLGAARPTPRVVARGKRGRTRTATFGTFARPIPAGPKKRP